MSLGNPATVSALIEIYVSPEPEVSKESISHLIQLGAVQLVSNIPECTPLGEAWVHAITQMPAPEPAFLDATGKVIKTHP